MLYFFQTIFFIMLILMTIFGISVFTDNDNLATFSVVTMMFISGAFLSIVTFMFILILLGLI